MPWERALARLKRRPQVPRHNLPNGRREQMRVAALPLGGRHRRQDVNRHGFARAGDDSEEVHEVRGEQPPGEVRRWLRNGGKDTIRYDIRYDKIRHDTVRYDTEQ